MWSVLTHAHPSLVEPADRLRAEFLSGLILGGIVLGLLGITWRAVIDPVYRTPAPFLATLASFVTYVVSLMTAPPPKEMQDFVDSIRIPRGSVLHAGEAKT